MQVVLKLPEDALCDSDQQVCQESCDKGFRSRKMLANLFLLLGLTRVALLDTHSGLILDDCEYCAELQAFSILLGADLRPERNWVGLSSL
jgi:hypothetical protein